MASQKNNFQINPWLLCFFFQSCIATDILSGNQKVADGMLLVSDGGIFALGFFSPGKSTRRYLGIWFHRYHGKSLQEKVVWVANRENPTEDSSGKLVIKNGNLFILGGNQEFPFWSSNVSTGYAISASFAKILDSGNLVLFQEQKIIWQSFDYPTHVWLPGMKIGLDTRRGFNRSLVSWKSHTNPSPGEFTLMLDSTVLSQLYLLKESKPYWRSGPWGHQGLTGVPDLPNSPLNFTFVNTPDEVYLIYDPCGNSSVLHYYILNETGMLQRFSWLERNYQWKKFWYVPVDQCDSYNQCGSFGKCNSNDALYCSCLPGFEPQFPQEWNIRDASAGCLRKRETKCGKYDGGFLKLQHVKIPDSIIGQVVPGLSLEECKKICMKNCSCSAYAVSVWNHMGKSCVVWYEDLLDTRQYTGGGNDMYLRVDAIEIANTRKKSELFGGNKIIQSAFFMTSSLAIVLVICVIIRVKRTKSRVTEDKLSELLVLNDYLTQNHLWTAVKNTELPFFDLDFVIAATENFSEINKLGEGGFGPVYKGRFSAEHDVAVKRLSNSSGQGIEEFKNEVLLLAKLQHRNLVRLLGCCIQGEEKMLIYEYMPNGSLDSFIFDETKRVLLDWKPRYNIIVGIARGILYLHQDARFRIIHRDLKASNVLLDSEKNPKISDFGAARIFSGGTQSKVQTKRVIGTYGYMSPEYATSGLFSEKSDVYSFGVLLLEIVSGKRNISYYHDDPTSNVTGSAYELWKEGRAEELVDTLMGEQYCVDEVLKCIHIGLLCVQKLAKDRPTMASVVFMLGTDSNTLPPPNPPAYVEVKHSIDHPEIHTLACVTTTIVQAR